MLTESNQRNKILKIYTEALKSVQGDNCVKRYLESETFKKDFKHTEKVAILAIGKASQSMAQGAYEVLHKNIISGLVVTKENHLSTSSLINDFEYIESSHPIPSQKSLNAGKKVIDYVSALPADTHLIVLISGGASSLIEQTKPTVSLDDLIKVNDWLISSGLGIEEINNIRQMLSKIKAGQLAAFAKHLKVSNLLLSDVLSNKPAYIGSGLFVESTPSSFKNSKNLNIKLPVWLDSLLASCEEIKAEASQTEPYKHNINTQLVATNSTLLSNIAALCKSNENQNVHLIEAPLSDNVEIEADKIASTIINGESGYYIWGGEPTVEISKDSGPANKDNVSMNKGGRNQHLALIVARKIKAMENIIVLCIGTDGTDGTTDDAGALVDGETLRRGDTEGLDVEEHLASFNSARFLQVSGDVINTGPTGTNVMDVVIAYKGE